MKTQCKTFQTCLVYFLALSICWSFGLAAPAEDSAPAAPPRSSETIPWSQVGAKAGADYHGEGLSVSLTAEGARLHCLIQRLEGEASRGGLWLTSSVTDGVNDRFRVTASAVGRQSSSFSTITTTGTVTLDGQTVRFTRPGLVEEYSVSMDGVRQDFIVLERPSGVGELAVRLAVSGAKVEPAAGGARLVLENSGRKIAYSRLRVNDANGKELPAHIQVRSAADDVASLAAGSLIENQKSKIKNGKSAGSTLAVIINDADSFYPIRIDPTFSDANWISMGGFPGADSTVYAAVVDGSGNLYIGGDFAFVGDVLANGIAKWNGRSWSALGSGVDGGVSALAVSGSDLYAGGWFTTAGGISASGIAKWNGSSWSALGSGMGGYVSALAVSGSDLYAGGWFTTAGGKVSAYVAKAIVNPPVLAIEGDGFGGYFLSFSGVPGSAYRLQRAPNLAGPWVNSSPQPPPPPVSSNSGTSSRRPARASTAAWNPEIRRQRRKLENGN